MSARGLLARVSLGILLSLAGVLAVIGGVAIGGTGLVAVVLAAVVAACVAAGVARESAPALPRTAARQAALEAAWRAVGWTVGGLLVVSGAGAVAGSGAALLVVLLGGGVLAGRWLLRRARGAQVPGASRVLPFPGPAGPAVTDPAVTDPAAADGATSGPAVIGPGWAAGLSVAELGRAWVRSSGALAATRDPAARARLVARRQQALDELERRDPEGFARWLAAGATIDSDPARWVSPPSSSGTEAA